MNQLTHINGSSAPALVAAAGDRAAYHFLEFFTAQIRNPNTCRAILRLCNYNQKHDECLLDGALILFIRITRGPYCVQDRV